MPLFKGSRYRFSEVIQATDANREVNRVHVLRKTTVAVPSGSRTYTTLAGDTFEAIAEREYGDGNKWYVLADVNPQIFWPLDLESGTVIVIPPRSHAAQV